MRITLKNVSQVDIGGQKAGRTFKVEADRDGSPAELFWRKRLADRSVEVIAEKPTQVPAQVDDPAPASPPPAAAVARPAPPRASKKD